MVVQNPIFYWGLGEVLVVGEEVVGCWKRSWVGRQCEEVPFCETVKL